MSEHQRKPQTHGDGAAVILDDLLRKPSGPTPAPDHAPAAAGSTISAAAPLVGECLRTDHPTIAGRVLVRIPTGDAAATDLWLPMLHGMAVRPGDRLLIVTPSNHPEGVAIGVIDGFALRPEPGRDTLSTITLQADERILVKAASGQDLLELHQSDSGPVVRLLQPDVDLDIPGALRVRAKSVRLEASTGKFEIEAQDDVVLRGETVKLN
jgi:hypothetical protein